MSVTKFPGGLPGRSISQFPELLIGGDRQSVILYAGISSSCWDDEDNPLDKITTPSVVTSITMSFDVGSDFGLTSSYEEVWITTYTTDLSDRVILVPGIIVPNGTTATLECFIVVNNLQLGRNLTDLIETYSGSMSFVVKGYEL